MPLLDDHDRQVWLVMRASLVLGALNLVGIVVVLVIVLALGGK